MNPTSDVLVVGGGAMGLAIAIDLKLRGASVTILSRDSTQAALHAAAGMLAPGAEGLVPGSPLRQLCDRSLQLYPDWTSKLEDLSGCDTEYWPCGILAPHYAEFQPNYNPLANEHPLDAIAIHQVQPGLSSEVVGGTWFADEAQVNPRALAKALRAAAENLGINIQEGVTVTALHQRNGQVLSVKTNQGDWYSDRYVLAGGAWSAELLPLLPIQPRKGQLLALQSSSDLRLHQVLYGDRIYIVPRRNGRIILGATSEAVGFTPGNSAAGIHSLLTEAIRLLPPLQHLPILEQWWGFRPTAAAELPILGTSHCQNLAIATGHHRNGILLMPITAHLITNTLLNTPSPSPDPLLSPFSYQRFHPEPPLPTLHTPISPTHPPMLSPLPPPHASPPDLLTIANRTFHSRLMTGTGKYRTFEEMRQSILTSGCEIITVAVRRVQTNAPGHEGLAEAIDWQKIWMLPNTAGCQTAEEAIRVARLGREMAKLLGQEDNNFVKLEVIPDAKYLLPDPIGTLEAAEQLVKEGFAVLPYINADPLLAKRLEEAGCATVMPLGSPIGSGQGIRNSANIQIIIENAKIPVVVDAGIGTPSEAAQAMEMGADALLINTAIAQAQNPALMGQAMGMAAVAGRLAYLAGRIPVKGLASASSPQTGLVGST